MLFGIGFENSVLISKIHKYFILIYNTSRCLHLDHEGTLKLRENSPEKPASDKIQRIVEELKTEEYVFYRTFFEHTSDGILLTKPDGTILAANPQACKMFGMTENELKAAKRNSIVLHDERLDAAIIERAQKGYVNVELTLKRKDGSTFCGEVSSKIFGDKGGVVNTSMIIRDITERKKTEQALKESEEKYRSLFNNMQNGFVYCKILTGENGKPVDFVYLEVNHAFERLVGIKRDDLLGKASLLINAGIRGTNPEFFEVFSRIAFTGETEHLEVFVKQFDAWLLVSAYGLKKGYFAAIIENITEQKRAREKLEDYSQGLELTIAARTEELKETHDRLLKAERFAAIGELAGSVGHDLRNPLTSIKNAAYYLNRKLCKTTDANEKMMFDVINKSIEHANKIINSLLEYSKNITLEIEECTPKSIIDYVLLMAQIPKGVKVKDQTQDEPTIWVDACKMERVFLNLIKNAVEAMPQGGILTVASQEFGDNVEFTFADTGIGISEANKNKIFMPLFTTKAQGMGFGLAICRRLVEAHGGKITVDSTSSKGTTFTVTLPVEHKLEMLPKEDVVETVDGYS